MALDRITLLRNDADRRLAHEIAAGVLRQRRRLDRRLAPLLDRGWVATPEDTKDLLRIGAYQLLELDRVPAYAAVQATVDTAKRAVGTGVGRFVNAVLRRLADAPPTGEPDALAERYSHPDWLVARWTARWGVARTETLLTHNNTRPPLVIQPVRWSRERLAEALRTAGIAHRPAPFEHGLIVDGTRVDSMPGYAAGAFVVQDAAQRHLLEAAQIPHEALVWDACAAPGGKTALLARRRRVIASDIGQSRTLKLCDTLRRTDSRVPVLVVDARYPPFRPASLPVVLVDAPCTATGTMARHPDARWRLTAERLAHLVRRQAELLAGSATCVGPGGRLVYMTCSLEPEENEAQVDDFLSQHPAFRREQPDVFVFPPDTQTDGGFMALVTRG